MDVFPDRLECILKRYLWEWGFPMTGRNYENKSGQGKKNRVKSMQVHTTRRWVVRQSLFRPRGWSLMFSVVVVMVMMVVLMAGTGAMRGCRWVGDWNFTVYLLT